MALKKETIYRDIISYLEEVTGNSIAKRQKEVLDLEIQKRCKKLHRTPELYFKLLHKNKTEQDYLTTKITINHTAFFREPTHFDFVKHHIKGKKNIRVWSSACSGGQEPYSIAFVLEELKRAGKIDSYSIVASDIDIGALETAKKGIYNSLDIKNNAHFNSILKENIKNEKLTIPEDIKQNLEFRKINLIEDDFKDLGNFDFIFCRNVVIYFSKQNIESLLNKLSLCLKKDGYLISGYSDAISSYKHPFKKIEPSIFSNNTTKTQFMVPLNHFALTKKGTTLQVQMHHSFVFYGISKINNISFAYHFDQHSKDLERDLAEISHKLSIIQKDFEFGLVAIDFEFPEDVHHSNIGKLFIIFDDVKVHFCKSANNIVSIQARKGLYSEERLNAQNITARQKANVFIVDDSLAIRKALSNRLSQDERFNVVGMAESAEDAIKQIPNLKIDIMTLDVMMPGMSGLDLLRKEKVNWGFNVIMLTSLSSEDAPLVMEALSLGAVDFVEKPVMSSKSKSLELLMDKIHASAFSKKSVLENLNKKNFQVKEIENFSSEKLFVIGSSTGGPMALERVLSDLKGNFPPILIAQHIPQNFLDCLVNSLISTTKLNISVVKDSETLYPNRVYFCPGGKNTRVIEKNGCATVKVSDDEEKADYLPSINILIKSLSQSKNLKAVVAILTGLGSDGSRHLNLLNHLKFRVICQDRGDCVVRSMPMAAKKTGRVDKEVPLFETCRYLFQYLRDL